MLDQHGFDLWADGYDKSVGLSEEADAYPFAGYKAVLNEIYRRVLSGPHARVLDIGFGTAVLTARLYGQGCEIYGQDFSARMLAAAQNKMPNAHLYQGDFAAGLAPELTARQYDAIVATYSLHHLDDGQKVAFLRQLQTLLTPAGRILVGDVAFATQAELARCRAESGPLWDDDEIYFAAETLRPHLPGLAFTRISHCAGVLELGR